MKTVMKRKKNIVGLLMLISFVVILVFVLTRQITDLDNYIFEKYFANYRTEPLTIIMLIISKSCSPEILLSICVLTFIFSKNIKAPTLISINLILIFLINTLIKIIVQRPRPIFKMIAEIGYSFPSAHSMVVTGFYGYIMYLIYKSKKSKKKKAIYMTLLAILMIATGISRMYLGVHYFSDVVGGFCLAVFYLIIYITYAPRIYSYIEKRRK